MLSDLFLCILSLVHAYSFRKKKRVSFVLTTNNIMMIILIVSFKLLYLDSLTWHSKMGLLQDVK